MDQPAARRKLAWHAAVALGLVVAWSGCGHKSSQAPYSKAEAIGREQDKGLSRSFSFARSPAEPLPKTAVRHLRDTFGAPLGSFDGASAQRITSPSGSVWVVAGEGDVAGTICLLQGIQGYVSCTTPSDFARRGVSIGMAKPSKTAPPQDFRVLGIAPDWVGVVQVSIGSDGGQSVPVRGGVYTYRADAPIFVDRLCSRDGQVCRRFRPELPPG